MDGSPDFAGFCAALTVIRSFFSLPGLSKPGVHECRETTRNYLKEIYLKIPSVQTSNQFCRLAMMLARVQNILRTVESSRCLSTVAASVKKGDCLEITRRISQGDVDRFTRVIGDKNPIHSGDQPAEHRLIPGSLLNGIVSGLVGSQLPGPGSILVSQKFSFPHKCVVDKDINIRIEVADMRKIVTVTYECYQEKKLVFKGEANLMHKEL